MLEFEGGISDVSSITADWCSKALQRNGSWSERISRLVAVQRRGHEEHTSGLRESIKRSRLSTVIERWPRCHTGVEEAFCRHQPAFAWDHTNGASSHNDQEGRFGRHPGAMVRYLQILQVIKAEFHVVCPMMIRLFRCSSIRPSRSFRETKHPKSKMGSHR